MEVVGCEVVDERPGGDDGDDEDRGAGYPPTLIEVSFDSEHGDSVEEGEDEEKAGVDMQEEESLLGDGALRVAGSGCDLERHVDHIPLGSDHHLHHHDEEQRQQLVDLEDKAKICICVSVARLRWAKPCDKLQLAVYPICAMHCSFQYFPITAQHSRHSTAAKTKKQKMVSLSIYIFVKLKELCIFHTSQHCVECMKGHDDQITVIVSQ